MENSGLVFRSGVGATEKIIIYGHGNAPGPGMERMSIIGPRIVPIVATS